ncbi:uncharacterized protein LOC142643554 isoform X1 [Castanea sativa]|uniref:uncharacterized protein LOC142643554 isoform X1 n=1 Tax=Castanea sativa TaxID=21020 RepID=UPI003F64A8FD
MDSFDDILGEPAANRAQAGAKFRPKAKPRPRKETPASVHPTISSNTKEDTAILPITDVGTLESIQPADVDDKLNNEFGSSIANSAENFTKNNEGSFSGVPNLDDTTKLILVNPSSQVVATSEGVVSIDALPKEVAVTDINGDWHFSFRQSETEAVSVGLDVDPSADISPEPVTLTSAGSDLKTSVQALDIADDRLKDPFTLSFTTPEIVGTKVPGNECSISDDLHSEAAILDGNGKLHPNNKKLAEEVDSLGLDLDPFEDNLHGHVTSKSRGGGKFKPKAKIHPRNETSTSLPSAPSTATEEKPVTLSSTSLETEQYAQPVAENKLTNEDGLSAVTLEIVGTREPSKDNECSFPDKRSSESIKSSSQLVMGEEAGSRDALQSDVAMCDSNSVWHSSIGMLSSEVDCMGFELEPFGDNEGEGSLFHAETSTLLASNNKDMEENFGIPACSSIDSSALRVCDSAEPHTCSDPHMAPDPVTCGEDAFSNQYGDFQIENGRLDTEFQEAGTFSGMESLDFMSEANIASGRQTGKFRPKPKMKTGKEKHSIAISHPQAESVLHLQGPQLVTSETGYMASVPAFPADCEQDDSMRFGEFIPSDPASVIMMNAELRNLAETSHSDGPILGDILHSEDVPEIPVEVNAKIGKGEASTASNLPQKQKQSATAGEENDGGKSSRKLRKRVAFQLIDEQDDGANDDFSAEPPSNSSIDEDEDEDNNDEYKVESKSQKKRAPRKSKKPEAENGKPVRKRKKANEAADQSTEKPPKKFSHSTRRNRRCVDKALLETPEDEIDPQRLPIKDLILLAEHKERLASKEAAALKTPLTNLSSSNSFHEEDPYNGEEAFASEQGRGSDDDEPGYEVPISDRLINYQSYMDKTPRTRWSKQDTELFYEAVRQFGTDFSMIQQLFPGRTRHQVKLKFKKEERQYPFRLSEALASRSKDHSHFQLVIERLQQASQAEQHSNREDSVGLTGEEEVEGLETETNEAAKPEEDEEVVIKDQEVDFAEVHSPVKSYASDDGPDDWI